MNFNCVSFNFRLNRALNFSLIFGFYFIFTMILKLHPIIWYQRIDLMGRLLEMFYYMDEDFEKKTKQWNFRRVVELTEGISVELREAES